MLGMSTKLYRKQTWNDKADTPTTMAATAPRPSEHFNMDKMIMDKAGTAEPISKSTSKYEEKRWEMTVQ